MLMETKRYHRCCRWTERAPRSGSEINDMQPGIS